MDLQTVIEHGNQHTAILLNYGLIILKHKF